MKKFLLSFSLIIIFISYSWFKKYESAHVVPTAIETSPSATISPPSREMKNRYKDGIYVGTIEDAYYGLLQVQATIGQGKISDVAFLQYPNDRPTSVQINQQAIPVLQQEAIRIQSAKVDVVSGATDSSEAFRRSLQSALDKAK